MRTFRRALIVLAGLTCCSAFPAAAPSSPSLDEVLAGMASYVREYIPKLANVVAREQYEQRVRGSIAGVPQPQGAMSNGSGGVVLSTNGSSIQEAWLLKSDILFVRHSLGEVDWTTLRDVVEADGKPVNNEPDRLAQLFATPAADTLDRAARIRTEGARLHLVGATPAVTDPLLVLALMQAQYQPRLRFTLKDTDRALGPSVQIVRFEEREEASGPQGTAGPRTKFPPLVGTGRIEGQVWVDTGNGRIVKTEARFGEGAVAPTTTTTFVEESALAILVPKEMRTTWKYSASRAMTSATSGPVTGLARYSDFRRIGAQAR